MGGNRVGGIDSYVLYKKESTYGTYATPDTMIGVIKNFTPGGGSNNLIISKAFKGTTTGREPAKIKAGQFTLTPSIEFEPVNFTFMELALSCTRTGAGTSGSPYSYVPGSTTVSATISHNIDDTTDREEKMVGCIVTGMTLRCSVGEPVSVSLNFGAADMTTDTGILSTVAVPSGDVFTFDGGDIEWPDGAGIATTSVIDSATLTLEIPSEVRYGFGSTRGVKGIIKAITTKIDFTLKNAEDTFYAAFLAASTPGTVTLKFSNGATKFIKFQLAGAYISDWGETAPVQDAITEDISVTGTALTVLERVS